MGLNKPLFRKGPLPAGDGVSAHGKSEPITAQTEKGEAIRQGYVREYKNPGKGIDNSVSEKERIRVRNSNDVSLQALDAEGFVEKFTGITGNKKVDSAIYNSATEMLKHRNGTNGEDLHLIDAETGESIHKLTTSKKLNGVLYDEPTLQAIETAHAGGREIIAIHNHPNGLPSSVDDGSSAFEHGYIKGIAVGHNLEVWTYGPTSVRYTPEECKNIHDAFAEINGFDVDFDEYKWYNMLSETGMEVHRK